MSITEKQQRPISLKLRLAVLAVVLLTVSLGLVGYAMDAAFHKSSEAGLRTRMESMVYLVLAAAEVAADGSFAIEDEPGDPRLEQPGSGIYASVSGADARWDSGSSLGVNLPQTPQIQ